MTRRPIALVVALLACSAPTVCAGAPTAPTVGARAPAWRLTDLAGRTRTLAAFRGRPAVLFFFCGCGPCHAVARLWAEALAGGEVPRGASSIVVCLGTAGAAKVFTAETGLSRVPGLVVADPDARVALSYDALSCPRAFVLDGHQRVTFASSPAGATPAGVVSRALTALRALPPGSPVSP